MKRTIVLKKELTIIKETSPKTVALIFLTKYPFYSFTLSEIAEKAGISKSTASRVLTQLQKEGFITIGQIANLWRVQFNINNIQAIGTKIGMNLIAIYNARIVDYIIFKFGTPKAIMLFGSYRKGEDSPASDIDIAIEISEEKELEIISLEQFKDDASIALKEWEKSAERKIKLHFFHRKHIDPNLFINIANGILLYGLLEVKP